MTILRLSEQSLGALENKSWKSTGKWLERALTDFSDRSPENILEAHRSKLSETSQQIVSISRRYGFMLRNDVLQLATLQLSRYWFDMPSNLTMVCTAIVNESDPPEIDDDAVTCTISKS